MSAPNAGETIGHHRSENYPAYVYELRDPETGRPRYVGVTGKRYFTRKGCLYDRLKHHLLDRNSCLKARWIADLKVRGLLPTIHCLEVVPYKQALSAERRWIEYLTDRGESLLNVR